MATMHYPTRHCPNLLFTQDNISLLSARSDFSLTALDQKIVSEKWPTCLIFMLRVSLLSNFEYIAQLTNNPKWNDIGGNVVVNFKLNY